jgi:hypothetical protein
MGVFQTPGHGLLSRYVRRLFPITTTVSGDLNSRVSQIEVEKGAPFEHAFMIRSRGIPPNRSALFPYEVLGLFPLPRSFCSFRFIEGQKFCGKSGLFSERADPAHGYDKGAGLQVRRSNPREHLAGFDYVVRDAEFGIAPGGC